MATRNHQVGIEINADVKGQETVGEFADRLDDVAKVLGGELKTRAQQAAAELRELAAQGAAIGTFNKLKQEANQTAHALKTAEGEVASYSKQIAAAGPPTEQEAAALQKLQAAAASVSAKLAQQRQALSAATTDLQGLGIASSSTQAAQQRLAERTAVLRDSVKDLAPAYRSAESAASAAGAGMARTHRRIGEGVDSISEQLARMQRIYAGFVGLQGMAMIGKDVAATADEFNNLQARIKLVTGEGKPFETAFEGVMAVALRTNSSLESTGNLFAKIAETGKAMGVGQAEALKLTETINQAVQLSGASAQASDAAVTQLIQGLQGGVLRGDEFNSVMEQSPRLAKALADGLSSTTGELRRMAEAGQLSSETVIRALRGQADTVAGEFSKLPPTVGRALQNLSTSWTLYVGETDKATGASSRAATAINALANNLGTIAGYLIDAGQAAAAFVALRLAQHFTGIGVAATQATTAVVANTAAVTAAGAAGAAAATNVGRFAAILGGLKTFTLVGIIANFKDIGTWIGEAAAKLAGYKDRTEELARADKLAAKIAAENADQRQRMADATQAAVEKQFELSKAARASIAEFDNLIKAGDSAAEAIEKIGKDFDLSNVPGIKNAVSVLDKLVADAKISASQFQAAWATALQGKDLAVFETQARAALMGTAREAERTAQVMDGVLREAVRRTGLDFDVISGGMSKASRSAINDVEYIIGGLQKLKGQGVDTAQVLTTSFAKAIDTADSQKAIDAITKRIESMRDVLGATVANGLLDQAKAKAVELKDTLEKLTPGIQSVREALKVLGVTSDEELKKTSKTFEDAYFKIVAGGKASARELQEAFKKFAEAQIAASDGVASEWLKNEATMRGLEITADKAGKSIVRSMDECADGARKFGGAVEDTTRALERQLDTQEKQISLQERQNALTEREAELKRKRDNVDKDGFVLDKNGLRLTAGSLNGPGAYNKVKEGGGSDALAMKFAQDVEEKKYRDNRYGFFRNNQFNKDISAAILEEKKRMALEASPEYKAQQEKAAAYKAGRNTQNTKGDGAAQATTTTPREVTVKIMMPDGTTKLVPTTEDGSKALIAALQGAKLAAGY